MFSNPLLNNPFQANAPDNNIRQVSTNPIWYSPNEPQRQRRHSDTSVASRFSTVHYPFGSRRHRNAPRVDDAFEKVRQTMTLEILGMVHKYSPKITTPVSSGPSSPVSFETSSEASSEAVDNSSVQPTPELAYVQPAIKSGSEQEVVLDHVQNEGIDALIEELYAEDGDNNHGNEEKFKEVQSDGHRPADDTLLHTSISTGLTGDEVITRRKQFGLNQMKEEHESMIRKFLSFFKGPILYVMWAAAALAGGLQDWISFGVVLALLFLNAGVGFIQEYQAGSIVDELKKTLALKAVVIRDSYRQEIESCDLVPGDILIVEEGVIIPADGRIVSADAFLQVDQSSITGESLAAEKRTNDECYSSSLVKRGHAILVVSSTGDNTYVGRAAAMVNEASTGRGHFREVLEGIGASLLALVVFALLVVWISSFYRSSGIYRILEFSLAQLIVGVPVGLPAVVTTTMAVGAGFLAGKKAIVQKLSAIESLAGVEILCSDKTGTLTKNKLTLAEPFTLQKVDPNALMLTACLAASRNVKGIDAIDKAFFKALRNYPTAKDSLDAHKILEFHPFDPVSKIVSATVQAPSGKIYKCVKGAPVFVSRLVAEDGPIQSNIEKQYNDKVAEFASRGFRSLGVARKFEGQKWQLLGIMPCSDPPRDDTASTIAEAKKLGLSIKMLTGDAVGIAVETSRQLGLGTNIHDSKCLGSGNPGEAPTGNITDIVEAADGFAEVFPQHKYNVVDILQQQGNLVAMTGDGVNDAPSLKKADTGIAVEGSSDAARSAADIVFLAPGLSAIIDAIKTSRQIFHRMHAYITYRIALSLHLLIFLGLWIAIMNQSLKLDLVVFLAIFADIATLAIAYDKAPYAQKPVSWNLPKLWGMSIVLGFILAAGTWVCFSTLLIGGANGGIIEFYGNTHAILFLEIALTQNWLIFVTRSEGAIWSSPPSWQLAGAVFAVDIVATLFCAFGWFVGEKTDIVTIIRVWVFSLGVLAVLAVAHWAMNKSETFDDFMHGKFFKKNNKKNVDLEDFVVGLEKVSVHRAE